MSVTELLNIAGLESPKNEINNAITNLKTLYDSEKFTGHVLDIMFKNAKHARDYLQKVIIKNDNFYKLGTALKNLQSMLDDIPNNIKKNDLQKFKKKFKNSNVEITFSELMEDIIKYNTELQKLFPHREEQGTTRYVQPIHFDNSGVRMSGPMPYYEDMYSITPHSTPVTTTPVTSSIPSRAPLVAPPFVRSIAVTRLPPIGEGGRRKRRTRRSKSRRNKSHRKRRN